MRLELDSELRFRTVPEGADPLLFMPHVDFGTLREPSIIDAYCKEDGLLLVRRAREEPPGRDRP